MDSSGGKSGFWLTDGLVIDRLTATKTDVPRMHMEEREFG